MKIITCYLTPTTGTVEVCGINVMDDPLKVKQKVGYLPEHNPLYLDMFVKEYLQFIAGLHKIPNAKQKVEEMIEMVGLTIEQKKKIGALSKGYRQRVGLAQALIHEPEVLILDEPTSGLDPNQLEDIRKLIINIGKKKTIMLSTHIMQEVEAICGRVIIIDRGEIKADNETKQLQKEQTKRQVIFVEFDKEIGRNKLASIPGVKNVKPVEGNIWVIEAEKQDDFRPIISRFASDNGMLILALRKEEQSLEEVFKNLTRKK
jgi:ABC-2 type transport system ATP-binding protein